MTRYNSNQLTIKNRRESIVLLILPCITVKSRDNKDIDQTVQICHHCLRQIYFPTTYDSNWPAILGEHNRHIQVVCYLALDFSHMVIKHALNK